eukprot:6185411-Pleurochrysis_carterae.AAC.8
MRCRARPHRRAAARQALLRPEPRGRRGLAGPAQEHMALAPDALPRGKARSPPTSAMVALASTGVDGRSIRRRLTVRSRKRRLGLTSYMGYEWPEEEEDAFEVEAIVGKVVTDGRTACANQGKANAGVVLYCIVWRDYPPDMVWYEPGENLGPEDRAAPAV